MSQILSGQVNIAPGPRRNIYGGEIFAMMKDPIKALTQLHQSYGGIVRFQKGQNFRYLVVDPQGIQHVLVENQKNYEKSKSYDKLSLILGSGLVTSRGSDWIEQRKLAQKFFRPQSLPTYQSIMSNETDRMLERWKSYFENSICFDLTKEMMMLSLAIVGKSLFGVDLSDQTLSISQATNIAIHQANQLMESPFPWMNKLNIPARIQFQKALQILNTSVFKIISDRRSMSAEKRPCDLLTRILEEPQMSDQNIRDQIVTFLLAGHETTATALSWSFYLILQNSELIQKIRAEKSEDLSRLKWTEASLLESLRLYPPVWIFSRQARNADKILNYDIEPGATINISPYLTQHSALYWSDPELFKPERFLSPLVSEYPNGSYIPFALGGRGCVGAGFAIQEMLIVVQKVLNFYDLKLMNSGHVYMNPVVVIRPKPGVQVSIKQKIL